MDDMNRTIAIDYGEKRVGIARAISANPEYILYDEPTTGLDPIMTHSINNLIRKIHNEEKLTSIIVTHEMKTVQNVSNRVLFLDEGIVVFFGDNAPEELQDFAVIHKLEQISGEIVVGTKISLSDSNLEVVSVGPVANENFKNLGHLVLKLDSSTEEAQLGDVRCTFDNKPNIRIGDNLRINN